MNQRPPRSARCIVIAGPNGAGKTTFAREFLVREAGVVHFVNADLIASGLSPLRPDLAARHAGRLLLTELARLAAARRDFAFESTLSGRTYLDVPRADVLRRFDRSWKNFRTLYRPLAHAWSVYDNAGESPRLLEEGP